MENKRKIKIKKLILILILISILAIGLKMILNYENKIELCQLKDNGSSQMMGYIITTKNKKTIVIDGGTDKDTQNLIEQIKQRTGKVDYWFITHPHKDHATCIFITILELFIAFVVISGFFIPNILHLILSILISWFSFTSVTLSFIFSFCNTFCKFSASIVLCGNKNARK